MNLGIRSKVCVGTLAAVIVGLVGAGWLVIRSVERTELDRIAEALDARSGLAVMSLRPLFAPSGPVVSPATLHNTVRELSQHARVRITIIQPDGTCSRTAPFRLTAWPPWTTIFHARKSLKPWQAGGAWISERAIRQANGPTMSLPSVPTRLVVPPVRA